MSWNPASKVPGISAATIASGLAFLASQKLLGNLFSVAMKHRLASSAWIRARARHQRLVEIRLLYESFVAH